MKLKQKALQALGGLSRALSRFPLAGGFALLSSVCALLLQSVDYRHSSTRHILPALFYAALLGTVLSVCAHLWEEKRSDTASVRTFSLVVRVLTVVFSGGSFLLQLLPMHDTVLLGMCGAGIAALALALYALIRNEPNADKAAACVRTLFAAALTVGVLTLGMAVCLAAFSELIWDGFPIWKCFRSLFTVIVTLAFFVFLSELPHPSDSPDAPGGIYRAVLVYAELPLFFVLLCVLYLYLIKILCMCHLPDGGVNAYALAAECVYLFNLFAVGVFAAEKRLVGFFRRFGGLLLVPIFAMQTAAVWVRVSYYGLTVPRTVLLLFMTVVLAFILGSFTRIGLDKPLLFTALLALVFTVTPLNVTALAKWQQSASLRALLEQNGMLENGRLCPNAALSDSDRQRIAGAFDYLVGGAVETPAWLREAYDPDRPFSEIFGFERESGEVYYDKEYISFSFPSLGDTAEDIRDYASIKNLYGNIERDENGYAFADLFGEPPACGTAPFVEQALALYDENDSEKWQYIDEVCVFRLDERCDFRLNTLEITWNFEEGRMEGMYFDGYLLERE